MLDIKKNREGSKLEFALDGRLDTNTYTDKNGIKRTDVFVVVREIDFCDKKNDEENQKDFENALNDIEPPLPID